MFIPYTKHCIDEDDIQAVVKCLRSDRIAQGPLIGEFERRIAETVNTKYAVVFNSGTSALEAAYYAIGLTKWSLFATTPITFIATINAGLNCGAIPQFVDIDPKTYCIDPNLLEGFVKKHRPYLIVPVHMAGKICDMDAIMRIADDHESYVVEDACHTFYPNFRLRGHMAVFSFHPAKHITTGEGGAVVTNDEIIRNTLVAFRDNGRLNYKQYGITGHNYRMSDINCALGISQLGKLEKWQQRRYNIAYRYSKELSDIIVTPDRTDNALHLYIIRVPNRGDVRDRLYDYGIGTQIHYSPVYRVRNIEDWIKTCPEAEKYSEECLSLPLYPTMTDDEVEYVIKRVKEVVK